MPVTSIFETSHIKGTAQKNVKTMRATITSSGRGSQALRWLIIDHNSVTPPCD
jgi:hypothetical protein